MMKKNLFSKLIFAILLAFTVSTFVYFGFGNIYSSKIFNFTAFSAQFHSGIYQYRILSTYFLVEIYHFLGNLDLDYRVFKLKLYDPSSEPQLYLSFYCLNTFFLVLVSCLLVVILESKDFFATKSEKALILTICILVIGFTQFVIVPYDVSSYFFQLLFFCLLLFYLRDKSVMTFVLMILVIIISTFNRETSALSLSLAATLFFSKYGIKKESLVPIFILAIGFISVYIGLRITHGEFSTNDGNLLKENFTLAKNYLGMLFWILFLALSMLIAKNKKNKKNILIFHVLSFPYIIICFFSGILFEIRLYIPLFIISLLLANIKTENVKEN